MACYVKQTSYINNSGGSGVVLYDRRKKELDELWCAQLKFREGYNFYSDSAWRAKVKQTVAWIIYIN